MSAETTHTRGVSCPLETVADGAPSPLPPERLELRRDGIAASASEMAWLRSLIDTFPDYVLLVNDAHRIVMGNAAVRRDLGLSSEQLAGAYCPRTVHGCEEPYPGCPLPEAVKSGQPSEAELHDPGADRWLRSVICPTPFHDQEGHAVFLHLVGDITERKRLERLRSELIHEVITSQDAERRRIARELHDETLQTLASMTFEIGKLEQSMATDSGPRQLEELRRRLDDAITGVRHAAHGLHPSLLDDLGLAAALERHVAEFSEMYGIEVDLEVRALDGDRRLPRSIELAAYRILQEALTNVRRHAGARHASVVVCRRPSSLKLVIEDDGRGMDTRDRTSGLGLTSIRERVALLSGQVAIEARLEGGTAVYADLPLPAE